MYLNKLSVLIFFCLCLRNGVVSSCVQKLGFVNHQDVNTSGLHRNPIVEYEYLNETTSLGNVIKYPRRIYAELVELHPNRSSFDIFFIDLKNKTTSCPEPQSPTDLNCNFNENVYTNSNLVSSLFFGGPDDDYNTVEMFNASCHRGNSTDSVTAYHQMETNMREYLELGCGALTLDVTVNYIKTDCAQQCQIECNGLGQRSNRPFSFNVDVDLYYYDDDNELVMDPNHTVYRNLTFVNAAQADDYASDIFGKSELNGLYKDFDYCHAPKPDTVVQTRKVKNSTFTQQLGHIEVEFIQENYTVSLGRYECLNLNTPKYNVSPELVFKKGNCVELFDQVDCGSNRSTRVLSGVPQDAGIYVNVLSMRSCCCKFLNCDFEGETYPFVSRRPQDSRENIHINESHSCQCSCSSSNNSATPDFAGVMSTIISKTLNYTSCLSLNNSNDNLYAMIFLNKLQEFKEKRDIKKEESKQKKAQKKEKKKQEKYEKKYRKQVERDRRAEEIFERERLENEKNERNRKTKDKQEKDKQEKYKQEKDKQEKDKQEKDKKEKDKQENKKITSDRQANERVEREKHEKEKQDKIKNSKNNKNSKNQPKI